MVVSPAKFAKEVIQEAKKVTKPSRKETMVATGMVFVMVAFASVFFFLVDLALSWMIKLFLGI